MVLAVGHEVAVALELEVVFALCGGQARFDEGGDGLLAGRVEHAEEVASARIGLRFGEQPVVQAHLGGDAGGHADPGDHALDLDRIGARRAALGVGHQRGQHRADLALRILLAAHALDHVAVFQPRLAARLCDRSRMGIIMLTAMGTVDDKVRGFEEGADLYLVKPIDRRELIACINSLYQRLYPSNPRPASGWQLHRSKRELHAPDSRCLDLTTQDLLVLSLLLEQAGVTRDRNEIVTHLGFDYMHFPEGRTNTVISRLRQKLSKFSPDLRIMTIRSRGYAYVGPDIKLS